MVVIDDLFVSGSSFASGWGEGFENYKSVTSGKSWVTYFAQQTHARNVWNYSIVGKPVGMITADTVVFCRNTQLGEGEVIWPEAQLTPV